MVRPTHFTHVARLDLSVSAYGRPSGLENFVGKPIPTCSPSQHNGSHHCCDCARGDLTSYLGRLIRKLKGDYFDHRFEFVRKCVASFLCGTANVRRQRWQCAAMRLIVTMAGT